MSATAPSVQSNMPVQEMQALLETLDRGGAVLTASERAARSLRRAFDRVAFDRVAFDRVVLPRSGAGALANTGAPANAWTPAPVSSLDAWMAARWHELLMDGQETRLLLNSTQEHALWRAIISAEANPADTPPEPAHAAQATYADLAAEAWRALALAGGLTRLAECGVSADGQAFVRWARAFERRCLRQQVLPAAQLAEALKAAVQRGALRLPEQGLTLLDFDSMAPALEQLFAAIEQAGCPVARSQTAVATVAASLCAAHDAADELRSCARWIVEQRRRDPRASIAVVVPQLEARRAAIERSFSAILPAAAQSSRGGPLYEFSLGQPLAGTAFARAALSLLRWTLAPLPLQGIRALLLSPHIAGYRPEGITAAEFDAFKLQRDPPLRPELTLAECIGLISDWKRRSELANLLFRLKRVAATAREVADSTAAEQRQSHTAWAEHFGTLIGLAFSLPGKAPAIARQVARRWESALDEMSTLDFDGSRVTAAEALGALERIARQTIFAAESGNAPVQILGPLELGAVAFDALWFLGADDLSWPPPRSPQPLIPWRLQRELGLRGADRARDLLIDRALTTRIANSAAIVVFSYAQHTEETELRPSPLLRSLALNRLHRPAEASREPLAMLAFPDTLALPVLAASAAGGARILEFESACSFRAFAELRVWSSSPEDRQPGLDASERGVVVHRTMQEFWLRVRDQQSLLKFSLAERLAVLDDCIVTALKDAGERARTAWDQAYLEVQRQRLRNLLGPWLELEAQRPPFAVYQQETDLVQVKLGPLTFQKLRIDRIDETAGGRLVIDYKTGAADPRDWRSDRPEQPQVPLYVTLLSEARSGVPHDLQPEDERVSGAAFAVLRPGQELAFKGVADDERVLIRRAPMDGPTFDEQLAEWRRVLTALAVQFAEGQAAVDPRRFPETCKFCGQRLFCRIDPAQINPQAAGPEDESSEAEAAREPEDGAIDFEADFV